MDNFDEQMDRQVIGDADLDVLVELVEQWGDEHNLHDPKAQLNKTIEEVGEIAHEITRNRYDTPELADAFGDTLVTIIVLSHIVGLNLRDCLAEAYLEISKRKGHTENGTFIKEEK